MNKGFTLIELLIVIAIMGILATIAIPMLSGKMKGSTAFTPQAKTIGQVSLGATGAAEVRCIEGYKFITTGNGITQVLDYNGNGVSCPR